MIKFAPCPFNSLAKALAHLDIIEDLELAQSGLVGVTPSWHDHDYITWDDGTVAWMEAGENSEKVGVMDLHMKSFMKRGKKRFSWEADMRIMDTKNVPEDAAIASKVKEYKKFLSKELDIEIGETTTQLDSRRKIVRSQEAAIGNLIADATREGVDADIAIANGGGIRAKKIYAPGSIITRRDILTELPFGNVVVKLELTGAQIWDALENGVSQPRQHAGRFPQVSGASQICAPVSSSLTTTFPKGSSVKMSRRVMMEPGAYIFLALIPPPFAIAISASTPSRVASAIRLPIAASCERTIFLRLSS
jgi:2',3'-cyclic-nucleotide 2'-phosphodiesterase (5'-nucleotidase family)